MRATSLPAVFIGVLVAKPVFAFTTLAVKSASCVISTGMHIAIGFIVPFLLIFGLYRTLQLEKDLERVYIENYFLLFFKVLFLAITIRLGVEMIHFFGVPVKFIAQDMLYCKNECTLTSSPDIPTCKGLPFEKVLKLLITASAFFSKMLAIAIPALAYFSLLYRSIHHVQTQIQRNLTSPEMAGFSLIKDGLFYFGFVLPYVFLSSFSIGISYTKIIEWFGKVMKGG